MTHPIRRTTTYKDKPIGDDFFKDNPDIAKLYPTQKEYNIIVNNLLRETKPGHWSQLIVTENGYTSTPNAGRFPDDVFE